MPSPHHSALADLGYTEEWLSAGVLDREQLAEQHERFESGGTRKTSRYRSQTVSAWLTRDEPLDSARVDAFLAVLAADPDPKLAKKAGPRSPTWRMWNLFLPGSPTTPPTNQQLARISCSSIRTVVDSPRGRPRR